MSIGIWQVVLILLIVLIIFGAGKLPKVMGDLAKGVRNFKKGLQEDEEEEAKPKPIAADEAGAGGASAAPVVEASVRKDEPAKS